MSCTKIAYNTTNYTVINNLFRIEQPWLSEPDARGELKVYANQILELVGQYRKWNFNILGVIGIDGSPCCGVDLFHHGREKLGTGAFIEELNPLMAACHPPVPVKGIQDAKIEEAIKLIEKWDKTQLK